MRNKVRKILAAAVDNSTTDCKHWLGRQDSNLRMAVPKTGMSPSSVRVSVRNDAVIHRLESIAYEKSAEDFGPRLTPPEQVGGREG